MDLLDSKCSGYIGEDMGDKCTLDCRRRFGISSLRSGIMRKNRKRYSCKGLVWWLRENGEPCDGILGVGLSRRISARLVLESQLHHSFLSFPCERNLCLFLPRILHFSPNTTDDMPANVKEPLNPLAIAKLLGPNTPTLDHFIRFFGTVRGTDKVLMVKKRWWHLMWSYCSVPIIPNLVHLILVQGSYLVLATSWCWSQDCYAYQKLGWSC